MTTTSTETSTLTHDELRQFTGDLERFRHSLNRNVVYTPGVRHVAQAGSAYWLIDEIALALGSPSLRRKIAANERARELLFWTLRLKADSSATLTAVVDKGEPPIYRKRIPWTDFPLDQIDIWCGHDSIRWTLYLPSEH